MPERPTDGVKLHGGLIEYRWEPRGPRTVVMVHGGHMRAGLPLGEEVFAQAGHSILAPSRPGYGRTSRTIGTGPEAVADAIAELCGLLGITAVEAVVGQSAGGPVAIALAARHPELVHRLILQSAVAFLPWPDRRTRIGGRILFGPRIEKATWALFRGILRASPSMSLRLLLGNMATEPAGRVVRGLSAEQRDDLLGLFTCMRSGTGFTADLTDLSHPAPHAHLAAAVTQPTLVIASRHDGSIPFTHAESLTAAIPHAQLITSPAASHMIWFGDGYPEIAETITDFLAR